MRTEQPDAFDRHDFRGLRSILWLFGVDPLADGGNPVRLVGIEEPETAFQTPIASAMMGRPPGGRRATLVVATTHRPELRMPEMTASRYVEDSSRDVVISPVAGSDRKARKEKRFASVCDSAVPGRPDRNRWIPRRS